MAETAAEAKALLTKLHRQEPPLESPLASYVRQRISLIADTVCTGHFFEKGTPAIQGTASPCICGVRGISNSSTAVSSVRTDCHFIPDQGIPLRLNAGLGMNSKFSLMSIPVQDRYEGQCALFGGGEALLLANTEIMALVPKDSIVAKGVLGVDMLSRFEGSATDAPFDEGFSNPPSGQNYLLRLTIPEFSALARTYIGIETRCKILHARYLHCGKTYLKEIFGIQVDGEPCLDCLEMKATRLAQPKVGRRQAERPNQFTQCGLRTCLALGCSSS